MTSVPRYTSKAEGFRTAEEIEALRPVAEPRPRAPRKAPNPGLRQVTNGIVCFCGERFGESQALEFMLHLRAEVGEVLDWHERERKRKREWARDQWANNPEYRELQLQRKRVASASPEYAERERERQRESRAKRRLDPAYRERENARKRNPEYRERARMRSAADPEYRERRNAATRELRARKKAEREAQS